MPDVIIIGSGFGGSIAAARYTEAGKTVAMLEMGEEWTAAKMQQNQDKKYILRVFRDYPYDYIVTKPKLVVTAGMGVGGGSLVYSGIHLRAPSNAFTGWPTGYTRANLDPYYARVETNLSVQTYPLCFPRPSVFAQAAQAAGLGTPQALPLAIKNCLFCGWCVPNCIYDRKQSMHLTYLARAKATGRLTIYPQYKSVTVRKVTGGYRVYSWRTNVRQNDYHLVNSGTQYYLDAPTVVIACGPIESAPLLQRSLGYLTSFTTTNLGKGIDGQGDLVTGGIVPQRTDTYKGAIMMSQVDRGDYVLQDIHGIPVGPGVKYPVSFGSINNELWGLNYKRKFRDYGTNMLAVAIIGKSPSGANATVTSSSGVAKVSTTAYSPPSGALEAANSMITALGAEVASTPWTRNGMMVTVHPTGGCAINKIVQPTNLQVYNNPNLYVVDGSVIPANTFRNPSHTICAIAEKAMDVILNVPGAPTW